MKRTLALLALAGIVSTLNAEMIFIDINNAPREIEACEAGLADKAERQGGTTEPLNIVRASKENFIDMEGNSRSSTFLALRRQIMTMLAEGRTIDSIVVSGEDGSGHFFGEYGNFKASELRQLYHEFPILQQTLKSAALWGCYPTSVHGAEQFWFNQMPGMQFTMGFTVQGPNKDRDVNHDLLRQFCERREEAVEATSKEELCDFHNSIRQLTRTSLGMCTRTTPYVQGEHKPEVAFAGVDYGGCYDSYELYEQCGDFFRRNERLMGEYSKYMSGELEPYDSNPDGSQGDLRKFYNQVQIWRHCAEGFKEQGYILPSAPSMVRLIKYKKVKENLSKPELNGGHLKQFDIVLDSMGLGQYKLGDITKLSRLEMNRRIEGAVAALQALDQSDQTVVTPLAPTPVVDMPPQGTGIFTLRKRPEVAAAPAPSATVKTSSIAAVNGLVNGIEVDRALYMAQCMRQTFVNLDYNCSPFSAVGDHPTESSACIVAYENADARRGQEHDPCNPPPN